MKILFVHERFGSLAGAEANLFITATELKKRGHVVAIAHGPSTGKGDANWKEILEIRYPLSETDPALSTEHALVDYLPDVVYVHKIADLRIISTLVDSGVPLIRMVHDHDIYCMRSYRYDVFTRKICTKAAGLHCIFPCGAVVARNHGGTFPIKFQSYSDKRREIELNKRFHRMVVVTRFMRDELLINGFDPTKIEIHPPVPRMGESSLRSNFSERNLIVFAGQIIRGKGVDVLLKALSRLNTKFECIILGEGTHRSYCEKLSMRLGLDNRVRFVGFVPQEELKQYYRECSVVAVPSVWPEPFATIGMEVLRYGIPVVAFDVGGIGDWLIDGVDGYLVPWMDDAAFAKRLEEILNNKALAKRMGEQGRILAEEKFSFPQYILNLENMFHRVIDEVRSKRTRGQALPSLEHRH
jgi:glycosyltransferase involved in cell wall biosynthesis